VPNLVKIDAVVSITRNFQYFAVWLENAYSCPQNWGFGVFHLQNKEQSPKRHICGIVLIMSVSSIIPEKSRGNKKNWKKKNDTYLAFLASL